MWGIIEESGVLGFGLFLAQIFLIIVPVIPYIPQYFEIRRSRDASGFSLYVCLALIASACIRIAYWMGRKYDTALLFQNFVVIFVLLIMIQQCIHFENIRTYTAPTERSFSDFNITDFWNWTNINSYIQATILFTITLMFIVLCLGWLPGVISLLGISALVLETVLTLPQLIRNWFNQTTFGMSKSMVALWVIGDLFKLLYFVLRDIPFTFILSVVLQVLVDAVVFYQIFHYGDAPIVNPQLFDIREFPH